MRATTCLDWQRQRQRRKRGAGSGRGRRRRGQGALQRAHLAHAAGAGVRARARDGAARGRFRTPREFNPPVTVTRSPQVTYFTEKGVWVMCPHLCPAGDYDPSVLSEHHFNQESNIAPPATDATACAHAQTLCCASRHKQPKK